MEHPVNLVVHTTTMYRFAFLLLTVFYTGSCLAQEQKSTDSVYRLLKNFFDQKNAAGIYELTGPVFRKTFTPEQFTQISNTNLFPLGKMSDPHFLGTTDGVSKYKVDFPTVSLALYLRLDSQKKIETFLFREFKDDTRKKEKPLSGNPMRTALDLAVDRAVQPYISLAATNGLSIGILKKGKKYFYGYGETTRDKKQIPDEHTIFEIGSITKTFTAILLADAVLNKKLSLDDPANKYLPDSIPLLAFDSIPITIQMLSSHTSALPRLPVNFDSYVSDPANPYKNIGHDALFRSLKTTRLQRKPGSTYEYSNLGVATLGVILERVNQKSFGELVQEKICAPLKMTDTRQFLLPDDTSRLASGYAENGNPAGLWDFRAYAATGGLRSTASDMLNFGAAVVGAAPAPLKKSIALTREVRYNDGTIKTGLGWHFIKPGKYEWLFQNGGTGGYRSYLAINPEKGLVIVLLSNTAIGTEQAGNELIKWLEDNDKQ